MDSESTKILIGGSTRHHPKKNSSHKNGKFTDAMCSYSGSFFGSNTSLNENNTTSQSSNCTTLFTKTPRNRNRKKLVVKGVEASRVNTSNNLATDELFHTTLLHPRYKISHGIKEKKAQSCIKEKSHKNNRKRPLSLSPIPDRRVKEQNRFVNNSDDYRLTQYGKLLNEKHVQKCKKFKSSRDSNIKQNLANRFMKEHYGFEDSSNTSKPITTEQNILDYSLNKMVKSSGKKNKLLAKDNKQNCEHPRLLKRNKTMQNLSFSLLSDVSEKQNMFVNNSEAVKLSQTHKLLPQGHTQSLSDVFDQECKRYESNSDAFKSNEGIYFVELCLRENDQKSSKGKTSIPDVSQNCNIIKSVPRNQAVRTPISSLFDVQKRVSLKNNSDTLRKSSDAICTTLKKIGESCSKNNKAKLYNTNKAVQNLSKVFDAFTPKQKGCEGSSEALNLTESYKSLLEKLVQNCKKQINSKKLKSSQENQTEPDLSLSLMSGEFSEEHNRYENISFKELNLRLNPEIQNKLNLLKNKNVSINLSYCIDGEASHCISTENKVVSTNVHREENTCTVETEMSRKNCKTKYKVDLNPSPRQVWKKSFGNSEPGICKLKSGVTNTSSIKNDESQHISGITCIEDANFKLCSNIDSSQRKNKQQSENKVVAYKTMINMEPQTIVKPIKKYIVSKNEKHNIISKEVSLNEQESTAYVRTVGKVDDSCLIKKRREHGPNILRVKFPFPAKTTQNGKSEMSENASSQNASKSKESFQHFIDDSISDNQFLDYSSDEELNFNVLLGKAEEEFKLTECEVSALKNLAINVTWEIPLLHALPNGVRATVTNCNKHLLDSVVEGFFLEEESAILLSNWEKFKELYDFTRPLPFIDTSGRKYGILAPEERLKFYQFLGQRLPNRMLSSICGHFQETFAEFKKGKFTAEEDKLIKAAAKYQQNKQMYSLLSKILRRSRSKIYRRHQLLKKQGLKNSGPPLTLETIEKIVASLVTTARVNHIEELRHTVIAMPIWKKVSEVVSIPPDTLNRIWLHKLYTYFFTTSTVYRKKISVELINWLYHESKATQWNQVDWKMASERLHDIGPLFLYFKKHYLVDHYVPSNIRKNFRECVTYLHNTVLPKLEAAAVRSDVPLMRLVLEPNMTLSQL